ncbi:MAG: efflux RND transporter periplasmic adaptor subunit [Gammaproteobacteria bacterium]|nr:efflux RND transporter periplasmic adaptor subunit [Gammaproteobacteria bacterium]
MFPRTMSLSRSQHALRTNAATGVLAALAMLLAGCGGEEANNMARFGGGPPPVVTEAVLLGDITDNYTALATARANEAIDVTPRVSSVVSVIHFEEGQSVDEGQVLVELDSREIRADLDLAEANLRERRSRYGRLETLAASQVVSEVELEEIQAQLQVAEAQVNSARARLEDTIIRAPFSGEVGLRRISIGGLVQPNTVITTLDDTAVMKIEFSVPEEYLSVMREDLAIEATAAAWPDRAFTGTVTSVDSRVDPMTRSLAVVALMPNEDGALKPGMFLQVDISRRRENVVLAPEAALVPRQGRQFVYVVDEGRAEERQVSLGSRRPGQVEILGGLQPGEQIVTQGVQRIRDGLPVRMAGAPTGPPTGGSAAGARTPAGPRQ